MGKPKEKLFKVDPADDAVRPALILEQGVKMWPPPPPPPKARSPVSGRAYLLCCGRRRCADVMTFVPLVLTGSRFLLRNDVAPTGGG